VSAPYRLEFFASDADPTGLSEDQTFLGSAMVMTKVGHLDFHVTVPKQADSGQLITATAIDLRPNSDGIPNYNTSEFSAGIPAKSTNFAVVGVHVQAVAGKLLNNVPVATFTPPYPKDMFSASIDWGDGQTSVDGTVRLLDPEKNLFQVAGTHTYDRGGAYVINVTVRDVNQKSQGTSNVNLSRRKLNQSEDTIAVNPGDPTELFAASNDDQGATDAVKTLGKALKDMKGGSSGPTAWMPARPGPVGPS
jgi:hypothetical protein